MELSLTVLVYSLAVWMASSTEALTFSRRSKCRPLEIASCRKLGYNQTRRVDEVYLSRPVKVLQQYIKLIDDIRCSKDALFFLCTIYSPVCFEAYTPRVLPCRSVCERVKKGCLPFVKIAGFSWPSELDCNGLPEYSTGVCIRPSVIVARGANRDEEKPNIEERNAPCPKCQKQQELQRFKQFKRASYVVEAEVKSRMTSAEGETKLMVVVSKVYKQGSVKIAQGTQKLLSPTRCVCPEVDFDKKLVIFGHEDKKRGELIFDPRSIVAIPSKQVKKKLQKWVKKYSRHVTRKLKRKQKPS